MKDVFFIGDVSLDEYYSTERFPKIKEKVIVHALTPQMGGSIANAACVFAALGNNAQFMTALNPGAVTKTLLNGLNCAGVSTEHMVFSNDIPDSKCIIILAEGEHTLFIPTLALERIDLREDTFNALCSCDYVYSTFCELTPLRYKDMGAADILAKIKQGGAKLWCDLDCAELTDAQRELFPFADVLFLNEKGAENMGSICGVDWQDRLLRGGAELIVCTEAGRGCTLFPKDAPALHVSGVNVGVTDVTGAGDTFGGSYLHAYTRTKDLALCAEFANFAAARAVTGMGARSGAASAKALLSFITAYGGDASHFAPLV